MPISGLVLTFDDTVANHRESMAALRSEPAVTVGVASGNRVAIVVDSQSKSHDQQIWEALRALPGVVSVGVAFVGMEDALEQPPYAGSHEDASPPHEVHNLGKK